MSFESSLTQTATIQRKSGVTDSHGTKKDLWVDVATNVPCRVSSRGMSPRLVSREGETQAISFYPTVYMGYRTDVRQGYRLVIDAENYEVLLAQDPAAKHHHLTITTALTRG